MLGNTTLITFIFIYDQTLGNSFKCLTREMFKKIPWLKLVYTASSNKWTDLINVFEIIRTSIASDHHKNNFIEYEKS